MTIISNSVTLHRKPKDGAPGAPGQDAPSISVGVTAHNGSTAQTELEYLKINGVLQSRTTFVEYSMQNGRMVKLDPVPSHPIMFARGTHLFFINYETMTLVEEAYADTYTTPDLSSFMVECISRYRSGANSHYVIVLVSSDSSTCTAAMRAALIPCGGMTSGDYRSSRKRHYFIGQCNDITQGQGYEEISDTPTLKEVTVQVQKGIGIVKNGIQGAKGNTGGQGNPGYDGCLIRRSEWEEGKEYRNDSDRTVKDPATGQYIIDEVSVYEPISDIDYKFLTTAAHRGKISGTTDSAGNLIKPGLPTKDGGWNYDADNPYYTRLGDQAPIRVPFADIKQAVIDYLQARQIVITDNNDQPYGAFGGGNDWPLWFGGSSPAQAVTRINRQGHLYSQKFATLGNGETHMEIEDGIMKVYGQHAHPNIMFGVDDNGCAILKFYNRNGVFLGSIGPDGWAGITNHQPEWVEQGVYDGPIPYFQPYIMLSPNRIENEPVITTEIKNLFINRVKQAFNNISGIWRRLYRFSAGYVITNAGVKQYYYRYSGEEEDYHTIAPNEEGCYCLSPSVPYIDDTTHLPNNYTYFGGYLYFSAPKSYARNEWSSTLYWLNAKSNDPAYKITAPVTLGMLSFYHNIDSSTDDIRLIE